MEMQGNRLLAISQQQAWDALNNPEVLKTCIAGCDKVERTAENEFTVGVSIKIGPVAAKFSGKISLADMLPPQSYTLSFEGQGAAHSGDRRYRIELQRAGLGGWKNCAAGPAFD